MPRALQACFWIVVVFCGLLLCDVLGTGFVRGDLEDADGLAIVACVVFLTLAVARRALARRVAVSILVSIVTLLTMELCLAIAFAPGENTPTWTVWPPHYECTVKPEHAPGVAPQGHFSTNSLGLRATELPAENDYRVLCVGGSTTECFYLDDARAWPAVAGAALAERGAEAWVANAGRSGLTSLDHVTLLANWPQAAEMDCWVVLCGVNDMGLQLADGYECERSRSWQRTFGYRRPGLATPLAHPLYRNLYTFALADRLWDRLRHGALAGKRTAVQDVNAAWHVKNRKQRAAAKKTDALPDLAPFLAEYEGNLRRIVEMARQARVRLVFLTQPTLWSKDLSAELEALCWAGQMPDGTFRSSAALAAAMDAYNDRLREVCQAEGIELVDLASRLPKSTLTFYDDCHFNDSGSAQVAALVAEALDGPRMAARVPRR